MTVWLPLESNPEVWNVYAKKLGLIDGFEFVDIWSVDEEMLAMIPQPLKAVVILFPITEKYEEFRKLEDKTLSSLLPASLNFMKQTIGNACGTIALLHALLNNPDLIAPNSFVAQLKEKIKGMGSEHIAALLEKDDKLAEIHEESSKEGQSELPEEVEDVDLHFACLVEKQGEVYELDGRKSFPVCHQLTNGSFVQRIAEVVRKFMEREPGLVASQE